MVGAGVDFELRQHLATNFVLGKHSTNRVANDLFGLSLHSVADRFRSQTGVSGVPGVKTFVALVA